MSYSNYSLNNRVSYLEYEIQNLTPPIGGFVPVNGDITVNNIKTFSTLPKSAVVPLNNDDLVNKLYVDNLTPPTPPLADVLQVSNNAGTNNIDMNNNDITNCDDIGLNTINGSPYNIDGVLGQGDTAIGKQMILTDLVGSQFTTYTPSNIELSDGVNDAVSFQPTQLQYTDNTGTVSATWADIISGSASSNTLQEVLTAGNSSNLSVNLTGANNTIDLNATNGQYKAYQNSAPAFNTTIDVGQVSTNAGASGFTTMTYGGITTNNITQYVALQPTRLVATNDYSIETLTTGDITINAKDNIKLKATDLGGTGKGISIDKTTPNIYYQMNTANAFDRLVISNNGVIESVSVSNGEATQLSSGSVILQNFTAQKSIDIFPQSINWGNQASPAQSSIHSVTGLTFNDTNQSTGLGSSNLLITDTSATGGQSQLTSNGLTITDKAIGGGANSILQLNNTNNSNSSVYIEAYKNKGVAGTAGDTLFQQSVFGQDGANTKQEYTRITHTIRDPSAGVEDGSMELGVLVNGGFANFIQLNGNDTPLGEVNFTRPLDFIGGSDANATIKTSGSGSVNINIDATNSAGTGAIALKTKNGTAGSGAGLLLTGNTLLSGSAGGNSGQHLCLTIGGVVYKIKLENP